MATTRTLRFFLLAEALLFFTAALVHGGALVPGYEHENARIAESVIGTVLIGGLGVSALRPAATAWCAFLAQGFAWIGTLIGITMVAIGVGPRTLPDVIYHAGLLILLGLGLVVAGRAGRAEARNLRNSTQ